MANQFHINDYFNDRHTNLENIMSRYSVDDLPNVIVGLENIGERHRENRWQNGHHHRVCRSQKTMRGASW